MIDGRPCLELYRKAIAKCGLEIIFLSGCDTITFPTAMRWPEHQSSGFYEEYDETLNCVYATQTFIESILGKIFWVSKIDTILLNWINICISSILLNPYVSELFYLKHIAVSFSPNLLYINYEITIMLQATFSNSDLFRLN